MLRFWPTAAARNLMCEDAGLWTSSFQKTAEATACNCADGPPRISVAALLALAHWCRQRRSVPGGGDPCQTPAAALSPPVDGRNGGADSAPATVASAEGPAAQGPPATAQR